MALGVCRCSNRERATKREHREGQRKSAFEKSGQVMLHLHIRKKNKVTSVTRLVLLRER